jgi:hypothetical protein
MNFYKNFSKSKKHTNFNSLGIFLNDLSFKTKVILVSFFCISSYMSVQAQFSGGGVVGVAGSTILQMIGSHPVAVDFANSLAILQVVKLFIGYIINVQLQSVQVISSTPINGAGIFDKITNGLTIFAAIACFYRLLQHYLNTERFDNAKAFTGFFGYISIFVLFLFSGPIVQHVASLNQNINTSNIAGIGNQIQSEVDAKILSDWDTIKTEYDDLQSQIEEDEGLTGIEAIPAKLKQMFLMTKFNVKNTIFTVYMSFFSMFLMASLAVPTVIMTLMVKVTLSIMILGAKLVFLLAFIPGFENTWKTYMLNLVNVLLWIPIFNVIISFLLAIVSAMISDDSIGTGQIIWLSIISMIFAYQSISLTTTTANTIISGAGAGIAGAMGSLTSMNATTMVAGTAAAGAGIAVVAASGGSAAPIAGASSKFSKD